MATGFAYYNVANVDKFVEVFTSEPVDSWRKENGIISWRIFKVAEEPNKVAIMAEYPTLEALHNFRVHPKSREVMAEAGMQGPPTFLEMETIKKSS